MPTRQNNSAYQRDFKMEKMHIIEDIFVIIFSKSDKDNTTNK